MAPPVLSNLCEVLPHDALVSICRCLDPWDVDLRHVAGSCRSLMHALLGTGMLSLTLNMAEGHLPSRYRLTRGPWPCMHLPSLHVGTSFMRTRLPTQNPSNAESWPHNFIRWSEWIGDHAEEMFLHLTAHEGSETSSLDPDALHARLLTSYEAAASLMQQLKQGQPPQGRHSKCTIHSLSISEV